MRLVFSPLAAADLEEIGDYIRADSPARALSFVHELRAQCAKLLKAPMAYPERADLSEGLRMMAHRRYLIFYTIHPDQLRIERVLHGARDLGRLL